MPHMPGLSDREMVTETSVSPGFAVTEVVVTFAVDTAAAGVRRSGSSRNAVRRRERKRCLVFMMGLVLSLVFGYHPAEEGYVFAVDEAVGVQVGGGGVVGVGIESTGEVAAEVGYFFGVEDSVRVGVAGDGFG